MSAKAAWQLVQIAELIRRAEELHLSTLALLGFEARAEIPDGADATVERTAVSAVAGCIADAAEIAEQLHTLGQALPDSAVHITYDMVRDAATADLSAGVLDPHRAIAAARVLDVRVGWPALADALRSVDVRSSWEHLALVDVLGRFRGADRQLVTRVLGDAGLPPDESFADCTAEGLLQLAIVLDDYAHNWRG